MAAVQQLRDPLRHHGCFLRVGVFLHLQGQQLHLRLSQRRMGDTFPQGLLLTIVKAAHPGGHTSLKNIVDAGQHRAAGAEIMG